MSTHFEKMAAAFADLAVTRSAEAAAPVRELIKEAIKITPEMERYILNGLAGAGVGVGLGALQPEKKTRNILYYGALGGLGGLGLSKLTEKNMPAAPQPAVAALSRSQQRQLASILKSTAGDQDKYKQLSGMANAVK
jgi:hypothetical protein